MNKINPEIYKAYDVRGVYPTDVNEEVAYRTARAFGIYLKKDLKKQLPIKIVLGQDMRSHSPFIAHEIVRGLNEEGIDVADLGRVPTPAFMYAVSFKDYDGGVMVTASHNPKQYNGLKFTREKGMSIGLASGLDKIRDYALGELPKPEGKGNFQQLKNIVSEYVEQELSFVNIPKLKRFKVVADTANAMGAMYLDEFFKRVDLEVTKLNWELNGNMPIHEANPYKPETLQQLREVVKNEHANLGIATDGDGDRIGFLDEKGDTIRGDITGAIIAKRLLERNPGAKIGFEVRSSRIVAETIKQNGGVPVLMPAGYAKMKPLMSREDVLFAAESSMHYMFRENYNHESPVFVISVLLSIMSEQEKPLSEIWREYLKYFHSGEQNFSVTDKEAVLKKLEKKYQNGKISHLDGVTVEFDDWWFNARASNTEPVLRLNLEADSEELMKEKLKEVSGLITSL